MKRESKIIFSPQLANYLLKRGYQIIRLKQDKNNPDKNVFVFSVTDDFFTAIEDWEYKIEKVK